MSFVGSRHFIDIPPLYQILNIITGPTVPKSSGSKLKLEMIHGEHVIKNGTPITKT